MKHKFEEKPHFEQTINIIDIKIYCSFKGRLEITNPKLNN